MKRIDINRMIEQEMKNNFLNATGLARKLGVDPSTVLSMLQRPTLQVERLVDLSEALNYNFFREIAEQLPYENPGLKDEKLEKQQERIKELEMEVRVLQNTLKALVGK